MYDKYLEATPILLNNGATYPFGITSSARLPKHKGLMFTSTTAGLTATIHTFLSNYPNDVGITRAMVLPFPASTPTIIPIQAYAIQSMAAGVSGWLLN
jgi:hypothetical protein